MVFQFSNLRSGETAIHSHSACCSLAVSQDRKWALSNWREHGTPSSINVLHNYRE